MIKFGARGFEEGITTFDSLKKRVLEIEEMGFDSVWFGDHLFSPFEGWTILPALAMVTKKLRFGNLVICNQFRYPSHLAKMATTFDEISKGRLEFGIGAGHSEDEAFAYGIPFPEPAVRIARLREAVKIIKKMWTEEKPSFEGKYYTIREAVCKPKPVQKPHPPMWIGGRGEKLLMRVVAESGDYSNFSGTLEDFKSRFKALEKHCRNIGRDPKEIKRSCDNFVITAKSEREVKEKAQKYVQRVSGQYITRPLYSEEPVLARGIVGTPEQCVNTMRKFIDLGITYFTPKFDEWESLQVYAEKVIPEFR